MAKETRQDNLIQIVRNYESRHPGETYELREVVREAIELGEYDEPSDADLRQSWIDSQCNELAQAARTEHHRDQAGRRVRSFHSVVVQTKSEGGETKQKGLWASMENAPPEHIVASSQQRYQQAQGDVVQLQNDIESFNEFHRPKGFPKIQMNFDFRGLNNRY